MRKLFWLLVIPVSIVLIYAFVPGSVALRQDRKVSVNAKAFARVFPDETQWRKWWPGSVEGAGSAPTFRLNKTVFTVHQKRWSSVVIQIEANGQRLLSELRFIPVDATAVNLLWEGKAVTSNDPVLRVKKFLGMEAVQRDMATVIASIQAYYGTEKNLYGLAIEKTLVKDSALIATTVETEGYPSAQTIYGLVDKLQAYAVQKGAQQTGLPMLNVFTQDSVRFKTQVAVPVNKKLPDQGGIGYRWMLGGGNILVAEVTGGPHTINNAFAQMDLYIQDNRRTPPAIAFQSLVTNRRQQPDTARWVTKLYWPVM